MLNIQLPIMPFAFRFGFRCCTAFFHFHPAAYTHTHAANVCNAFFTTMRNLPNALRASEPSDLQKSKSNPKLLSSPFADSRSRSCCVFPLALAFLFLRSCSCSSSFSPLTYFVQIAKRLTHARTEIAIRTSMGAAATTIL